MTKWSELDAEFRRIAFRDGIQQTAEKIPSDRSTVYRLVNGETTRPSNAIRAGVERIIREDLREGKPCH